MRYDQRRASYLQYAVHTIPRAQKSECLGLEKSLIEKNNFVLMGDHYGHPDPRYPFVVTLSRSNKNKGYFYSGYLVGKGLEDKVDAMKEAVNNAVGNTTERHVNDIQYVGGCLLIRYALSFTEKEMQEKEKINDISTEIHGKVNQALGKFAKVMMKNIDPEKVYHA